MALKETIICDGSSVYIHVCICGSTCVGTHGCGYTTVQVHVFICVYGGQKLILGIFI